jgi:hypothetical protein
LRGGLARSGRWLSGQFEIILMDRLDGFARVELDAPTARRPAADNYPFTITIFGVSLKAKSAHPDTGAGEQTLWRSFNSMFHASTHLLP